MNNCGKCTACCSTFEIKELNKPIHEDCVNLTCDGCSIYSGRPKVCKRFECAYITGNWQKELRPDLCGVMILKSPTGIEAFRLEDKVTDLIMRQIDFMQSKYGVKIKGVDAREVSLR